MSSPEESIKSVEEQTAWYKHCMAMLEKDRDQWMKESKQKSAELVDTIKKIKIECHDKVANLYCELQIRDIKLKDANDDICSLQEKLKALETDRSEVGVLKEGQRRIQELETENESLKLKGMQSLEFEQTFEEKLVHLQIEIARLRNCKIKKLQHQK